MGSPHENHVADETQKARVAIFEIQHADVSQERKRQAFIEINIVLTEAMRKAIREDLALSTY